MRARGVHHEPDDGALSRQRGADISHAPAQPAVRRIGIEPRVPEQRHRDFRHRDRKRKTVHAGAQDSCVALGNVGDQLGGSGERQRRREAADDRDDLACQPEPLQGFIDRPLSRPRRETKTCRPAA